MVRNSSFHLPQLLSQVDRHIDGHDYMWALSEMLDSAKEFIFILVCSLVWFLRRCSMFAVRIGGSRQSFTCVDRLLFTKVGGWTAF
jgi:phosphatidylserine/phosphatidylglycerophosphate/cardiolipin synthase-like enzyme